MKQKTPHKHAELIKKWADDTSINLQYKSGDEWKDVVGTPFWAEINTYRIKPEVIRYRAALVKDGDVFWTHTGDLENRGDFIKWLTGWIEVEVYE